jgi:DNA modification methylase
MQELPSMAKFHGVSPGLVATSHSIKSNKPMTSGVLSGIERWPLDRLIPYARNARTHSEDQVAQIAASIVEFGWTNPILVDSEGDIVAGHGRLMAARKLGLDTVPVVVLDHLTPVQRRAYVIIDNKLALNAWWDEELLATELHGLNGEGFDLALTGFSEEELDHLMGELEENGSSEQEDEIPEPPVQPVTRPGDLWLLGPHRLLCGDATIGADADCLVGDTWPDMCFTDSPYNVDYAGGPDAERRAAERRIMNDALGEGFARFLFAACSNIVAYTNGAIYMCMSSSELHTLQSAFTAAGGHWSTFIIWAKDRFTLGRADYQRQFEPILYGWPEGKDHYWCGDRDQGDVWFIDRASRNDLHPTMKPVALVEKAIRNSSRRGAVVLDPFGGSGTTLIACCNTERQARLLELDPRYCDVIVRRWQEHTGQLATLAASGQTFADLESEKTERNGVAAEPV